MKNLPDRSIVLLGLLSYVAMAVTTDGPIRATTEASARWLTMGGLGACVFGAWFWLGGRRFMVPPSGPARLVWGAFALGTVVAALATWGLQAGVDEMRRRAEVASVGTSFVAFFLGGLIGSSPALMMGGRKMGAKPYTLLPERDEA